jgi:hypothetical protein
MHQCMNVVWHACNHAYFVLAGVDVRVAIIVIQYWQGDS